MAVGVLKPSNGMEKWNGFRKFICMEWFEDPQWNGGWVAKWDKVIDKGIDLLTGVWKPCLFDAHKIIIAIQTQYEHTPGEQGERSTQGLRNTLELFGQHSLMVELGGN